jgi:hypothetical protein
MAEILVKIDAQSNGFQARSALRAPAFWGGDSPASVVSVFWTSLAEAIRSPALPHRKFCISEEMTSF